MKKLSVLLAIGVIMAMGCHKKKTVSVAQIITDSNSISDTSWVIKELGIAQDSFLVWCGNRMDSLSSVIRQQKNIIHSKDSTLFESNLKLARVWYYDSLCLKNSRLDKYLKGWIRRALEK